MSLPRTELRFFIPQSVTLLTELSRLPFSIKGGNTKNNILKKGDGSWIIISHCCVLSSANSTSQHKDRLRGGGYQLSTRTCQIRRQVDLAAGLPKAITSHKHAIAWPVLSKFWQLPYATDSKCYLQWNELVIISVSPIQTYSDLPIFSSRPFAYEQPSVSGIRVIYASCPRTKFYAIRQVLQEGTVTFRAYIHP